MTREARRELNYPSPVNFLTTVHAKKGVESPVSGDDLKVHNRFRKMMKGY